MALHDTNALILESDSAAESLPDPTTVAGRTHDLTNTSTASAVWSSTGATPFLVDGVAVATLTVPAGRERRVQSDGTRWVVAPTAARRIFAASGVSNGSGDVVFTFSPPFSAVPKVAQALETTNANAVEARVTALSASSCTVNVRTSAVVVVLGINVLGAPAPLAGATVHLHAIEAGQGI